MQNEQDIILSSFEFQTQFGQIFLYEQFAARTFYLVQEPLIFFGKQHDFQ